MIYGALVFMMEFLPFGAVNPSEVSEYFGTVRAQLAPVGACVGPPAGGPEPPASQNGRASPPSPSSTFAPSQVNVGIKGVPPGPETVQHLRSKVRQAKFWGGMALGGLAVTAHLFDSLCQSWLGTTLATTSLIIIVGAVLQTARQVESTAQGPKLQRQLERERSLIGGLGFT